MERPDHAFEERSLMHPKIDADQSLTAPFTIRGPVDEEPDSPDDDLLMAITFVITQESKSGGVVKGVGKSDGFYTQADRHGKWTGQVKLAETVKFEPGRAHVEAFAAIVTDDGEWELYPWGRWVNLA
jgi:hypothetical protein